MRNNVGLFLTKRAELNPSLDAYVEAETGQVSSFAELNLSANRTANFLLSLGVRKGDRIGLLMMNSREFMESFFAIAKIGAVGVPLNWRLVPDELEFILKDAGVTVLLFGAEFSAAVTDLQGRAAGSTDITRWVHVGDLDAEFSESYAELHASASEAEPETTASDDDLLYIMYTSGTTGLPKGAVHTHTTVLWAVVTINATAEMRFKDRYLVALPLFHVGALTPLIGNVYRGITSVVMRTFDPLRSWQLIAEQQISVSLAVPAMLNFMLQVLDKDAHDYSSLRWMMSGAAPVPVTLIEQYSALGIEIHQIYGLTECCGPACLIGPDDALAKAGSTGKAFFHTDVRVVDSDGKQVAPGEPGEVMISGGHLMREYWNRPEATAETIRDGWLASGDVATVDEEGFIYIQDRTKDMIISGGENVYPAEIENVILTHPMVGEVAVIGQPSAKWGESPLAIVVRSDDALTEQVVLDHCQGKLAPFKLPKACVFIDVIPRNPTGKVLKRLLREQFPEPARA